MRKKPLSLRIIGLLLGTAMLVMLPGCGSADKGSSGNPGKSGDPDPQPIIIETRIAGDDDYGYLEIPKEWLDQESKSDEGMSMYLLGASDQSVIITMMVYEPTLDQRTAEKRLEEFGNQNSFEDVVNHPAITLDDGLIKNVTKISLFYPDYNVYMTYYVFTDPSGIVHYISAESQDADQLAEAEDIIELTYSLTK